MHTSQLKPCTNCDALKSLTEEVGCTIFQLSKNNWTNKSYNTSLHFDISAFRDLMRMKRILYKRHYNPAWPLGKWSNQDLFSYIVKHLYRSKSCTPCPCEDFEGFFNTSSTTSSSSTTTNFQTSTSSTTINFNTSSTTTLPPVVLPPVECGTQTEFAGGQTFPSAIEIVLGSDTGNVVFNFNAFNIPDKFTVWFDGVEVINTGYRGDTSYQSALNAELSSRGVPTETIIGTGIGTTSFNKNTATTTATVYVYAPLSGTGWNFTLECPQ